MQQIGNYDKELNYLPYRYRRSSSTNPKRSNTHSRGTPLSASRPKAEKYTPQRLSWEHCRPLDQTQPFGGSDILVEQVRLGPQRERLSEDSESMGEEEVSVASELELRQTNHWREAMSESQPQQLDQNASPIKQLQESSEKQRESNSSIGEGKESERREQYEMGEEKERGQQQERGMASPQKMSSIFNESDVREIKENILNNIRQSSSHQSLHSHQDNHLQTEVLPKQVLNNAWNVASAEERLSFDARFERIRAINQHYEENQEFNRNLKRMEMMKKANKIKQIKQHQKNTRQQGVDQHRAYALPLRVQHTHVAQPLRVNPPHEVPAKIISNSTKQAKSEVVPHIEASPTYDIITYPEGRMMEEYQREPFLVEREKQAINNHSINTTNSSSYVRHREGKVKPTEILTFEKYKQKMRAKESSVDPLHKNVQPKSAQPLPPSQFSKKFEKIGVFPVQIQAQMNQSEVPLVVPEPNSDLLSQFSKCLPNKAMAEAKAAKSQQKQSSKQITQKDSPSGTVGYGNSRQFPPPPSNSYRSKQLHGNIPNETYSHNMKKKKDPSIPSPNRQSEKGSSISNLLKIQEQPPSLHNYPQQQRKTYSPNPHSQQFDNNTQILNGEQHSPLVAHLLPVPIPSPCLLRQSDLHELQQGIANFLLPDSEINRSPPEAQSHASSQAASRVLERTHQLEELKSQDGQELLKIMAVNTNFKELSSLVFEDRSPDPHDDLSLISHELGEIINSNQSELSATPTPQQVSLSSSLNYPFEESYEEGFGQEEEGDEGEEGEVDSRLIQINEDSRVFQERLQLQSQIRITPSFQEAFEVLDNTPFDGLGNTPSHQNPPSSRRSIYANAGDSSTLDYRSHFHPSSALRKYKHAKHNSEDFREKSIASARINHSLSTLRRNGLSLESSERVRNRLQKNRTRFRTRLGDQ